MNALSALKILQSYDHALFQTRDVAAVLRVSHAYASRILGELAKQGFVTQLIRGCWVVGDRVDPLQVPQMLTAPDASYISLYTALYHHGIIMQIPAVMYVVSTARSKKYHTPLGSYSIHHINPLLCDGYQAHGKGHDLVFMATPEKALFDLLYFSPAKTRLFDIGIEMEFPADFNWQQLAHWIGKIKQPRRQALIRAKLERLQK